MQLGVGITQPGAHVLVDRSCVCIQLNYSLDVRLVERGEDGVDGHGCRGEVEVVEEDREVVVQAPRRPEPDVERAAGHALDRTVVGPRTELKI